MDDQFTQSTSDIFNRTTLAQAVYWLHEFVIAKQKQRKCNQLDEFNCRVELLLIKHTYIGKSQDQQHFYGGFILGTTSKRVVLRCECPWFPIQNRLKLNSDTFLIYLHISEWKRQRYNPDFTDFLLIVSRLAFCFIFDVSAALFIWLICLAQCYHILLSYKCFGSTKKWTLLVSTLD